MYHRSASAIVKGEIFGIFTHPKNARVVLIPMPLEVTGFGDSGTALAPENILRVSCEINLTDSAYPKAHELPIAMLPIPHAIKIIGKQLYQKTQPSWGGYRESSVKYAISNQIIKEVDREICKINHDVNEKALKYLRKNKIVGLIGGESSIVPGFLAAMRTKYSSFGILHIGAQANLQATHQGFTYGYASVMYHALKMVEVTKLVQVGLRDCTEEEKQRINKSSDRIVAYFNHDIKKRLFEGATWQAMVEEIVTNLPKNVYIHFDINGLDAKLCPDSSRPVPGGLDIDEAAYLVQKIVDSGKVIIGFDLCEIGSSVSSDWDALVGSHVVYLLSTRAAASQGFLTKAPENLA